MDSGKESSVIGVCVCVRVIAKSVAEGRIGWSEG
jgi:hypothetical protein